MPLAMVLDLARDTLSLALLLCGPLLGVALGVGLIVSLIQAVTSIQEQTLSFVPKLFAVVGTFLVLLSWMVQALMRFTIDLWVSLPGMLS
jgi:flagellar biosynthetic protein FliQ